MFDVELLENSNNCHSMLVQVVASLGLGENICRTVFMIISDMSEMLN